MERGQNWTICIYTTRFQILPWMLYHEDSLRLNITTKSFCSGGALYRRWLEVKVGLSGKPMHRRPSPKDVSPHILHNHLLSLAGNGNFNDPKSMALWNSPLGSKSTGLLSLLSFLHEQSEWHLVSTTPCLNQIEGKFPAC